jgi:hypothetical protein
MKHLFHLGLIALLSLAITSCSKSTNDLLTNSTTIKKEIPQPIESKKSSGLMVPEEGSSKIFTFINQPYEFKLGDPDSYLVEGETAVFYVVVSKGLLKETPLDAQFLTLDENNGDIIDKYQLHSFEEAAGYGIHVPDELTGSEFMFSIVEFNNQYAGKTLGLHSEIFFTDHSVSADLANAFSIKPL